MTVNEPGLVARRQMALTHPLAADWPRWLRSWWGLIQPPALLLRIGAFPTLTRLPSPSLFPSLSLDVLGRMRSFLSASLPFLDSGGNVGMAATTPRFDYRLRRPVTVSVRNAQLEFGAPSRAELSPLHTDGTLQPHAGALEPEATAPAHASTDHEPAEADSLSHEAAPEASLTPFQQTEWELPAPASGHLPTLDEAVHHAEEWREAWGAANLPAHVPQTFGVLRSTLGSLLPSAMVHGTTVAAHETEASASHPDLTSELSNVLAAPRDLAGEVLSGLEKLSPPRILTDLRMPGSPFQLNLRTPPSPPRGHDLPSGEASGLPDSLAIEHWPLLGEIAERTAQSEASTLSPFSFLGAVPHVSQLLTSQRNPLLGEILHRQERAVEALSLVAPRPADMPGVHLPDAMAAGEPAGAPARHQPDELVSTFPAQFESLHRLTNLPNMALRTANIEDRASSLVEAILPETRGGEGLSMPEHAAPEHESQESVQTRHIAQASDRMLLNSVTHAAQPVLDLMHPLDTVASTFRHPSQQVLRNMLSAGAAMGMASLSSLPGLGHSEPLANLIHPARDVHQLHDLASESVAGTLQPAALTIEEQFMFSPGRTNLGGPLGLSLLGREFAHTDHPLALRPLPDIANLLVAGAEHAAKLPEQVLQQSFVQELLPPPSMEVRREAHVPTSLLQAQSSTGGFTGGEWSDQASAKVSEYLAAATPHPAETPAAGTPVDEGDSGGTVWQGTGAAPAVGSGAGSGASNLDSIARQVFALLQSQLRAERDRHQIYDR